MVKLRLKRMGKIDTPFYRIVALDSRKKRDGAYLDALGYYDPKTDPVKLKIDVEKAIDWLKKGAQPSDTVRSLFKKSGILEKVHNEKFGIKTEKKKETKTAKKENKKSKSTKEETEKETKK